MNQLKELSSPSKRKLLLYILYTTSTLVKEIFATAILVNVGIFIAIATHLSLLLLLSIHAIKNIFVYINNRRNDNVDVVKSTFPLFIEILFHCLGIAVAMAIGAISYSLLSLTLLVYATCTVVMALKQNEGRKIYLRRVLKTCACLGSAVFLTYIFCERTGIVHGIANRKDLHGVFGTYGTTKSNSLHQFSILMG